MFKVPSLRVNSVKPLVAPSIKITSIRSPAQTSTAVTETRTSVGLNRQFYKIFSATYTTSRNVFCHECGTKGIGKFCWNCGTKIFDPATQPFPEQRPHTEKPHSPVNNIPFQQPQHIHHHNVANNAPPKQTIPPQPQKLNPFEHSESEMFPYMFGSQSPPMNLQQLAEQQQQIRKQELQNSLHNIHLNSNTPRGSNPVHTNNPKEASQGIPLGNIFGSAVGAGLGAAAVRPNSLQQQPQQPAQDQLTPEELARELEDFAEEQLLHALQRPHSLEEEAMDEEEPVDEEVAEEEGEREEQGEEEDEDGQPIRLHVLYPDRL